MRCPQCHRTLPKGSRFCRHCGVATTGDSAPQTHSIPPFRHTGVTFCRDCGKPIDKNTRRCIGCGKQYFRGIQPMTFLCIVLAITTLALAAALVVQGLQYQHRINILQDMITTYQQSL